LKYDPLERPVDISNMNKLDKSILLVSERKIGCPKVMTSIRKMYQIRDKE